MPLQATSGAASYDAFGGGVPAVPNYIEEVFSTYLYTGNGSTQTITNGIDLSTKGGLVWIKSRTVNYHALFDTARGATTFLKSNATDANETRASSLTSFNTNGFSLSTWGDTNGSGTNFASWTFRKQPKFFDVVTFTSSSAGDTTFNHNLGVAAGCIILKNTQSADGWVVYHRSVGNNAFLRLNTTAAQDPLTGSFSVTSTSVTVNASLLIDNNTYVAYLFAHDAGGFGLTGTDNVISCGSYTGNGSATGPVIDLGYEPQFVIIKRASNAADWMMHDNMRGLSDTSYAQLRPNLSDAEYTGSPTFLKVTATGFQITTSGTNYNASGNTYIYIAIRRGPMKVPTDATKVFIPNKTTSTTASTTVTTNFPVDLTITKDVASGTNNFVYDRLRGSLYTSSRELITNSTAAESSRAYGLGFDNNTGYRNNVYNNNETIAWWNFKRAPSFFDEVCYTGTGSATTVTHNLGVAPELIIVKNRGGGQGSQGWISWNAGLPSRLNLLRLDTTAATYTEASARLNVNALPTATQFEVGTDGEVNGSGGTYVAYLFATAAGVSKVGSYTGNGSSQTINCGFIGGARFVLIKKSSGTGDWMVSDSARGIVSGNDPYLELNNTNAEVTGEDWLDTDSTGFVVNEVSGSNANTSGATYIFLAIA